MTNSTPTNSAAILSLRPKQAAKALGISERKLWALTADQTSKIPHFKLGGCLLYPVAELRTWLAQQVQK